MNPDARSGGTAIPAAIIPETLPPPAVGPAKPDAIESGSVTPVRVESRHARVILFVVLLGVTAFLRLYRLHSLPGSLYYDEAQNGVDALAILGGSRPVFLTANNGREALVMYLQAISIALLGPTAFALRIVPALAGCATVIGLFFLGRMLHGWRVGMLAAMWLAISLWHVSINRLGLRASLLPLFEVACVYCTAVALRDRGQSGETRRCGQGGSRSISRQIPSILAGVSLGLSFYTYSSSRLFPVVAVAIIGGIWLGHRRDWGVDRVRVARVLGSIVVVSGLVFVPLGVFFVHHPEFALQRAEEVTLGSPNDPRLLSGMRPQTLPENTAVVLGMFGFAGDENPRHNLPGRPVFDLPSFALFLMGIGFMLRRGARWMAIVYLSWLLVMIAPSAVTIESPHFHRTIGALPAVYLIFGLGADRFLTWAARRGHRVARLAPLALAALFLFGLADTYRDYFVVFAASPIRPIAMQANATDGVARLAEWRAAGFPVWTVTRQEHPAFRFLLPMAQQPTATTGSIDQAVVTLQAHGATVAMECFGCGQVDVIPVTLVAGLPAGRAPVGSWRAAHSELFGGAIELDGFAVGADRGVSSDRSDGRRPLDIWLEWRVGAVLGQRYHATTALTDAAGRVIAVANDPMEGDLWPTTLWRAGERYATTSVLAVPEGALGPGKPLRLAVTVAGAATAGLDERVELGTVDLASPADADLAGIELGGRPADR